MIYREWFVNFRFPGHEKVPIVESVLGPIPEGWQTGILRDVCDSMDYGYTASASVEPIGPKFLRITDIVPSVIDWHSVPHCASPEKNADKYALRVGDIVVARTGATTGYAKRLNKKHPAAIFASYLVRLRIKPNFSNHLFGVLVESDEYKRFIQGNWSGAAQPQANAQVLTSIPILIAPEPLHRQFSALAEPLLDLKETLQFKNLNLRTTRDFLLPKLISGEIPVEAAEKQPPNSWSTNRMSYFNPDSEDAAIEQPTIALFAELGWETLNCYHETFRAALLAWPGNDGRSRVAESSPCRHRETESRHLAQSPSKSPSRKYARTAAR